MKKTGLFKIIMFVLLGIVVMSWIFSASYFDNGQLADVGMYNIGFFDFFQLLFSSFAFTYFLQILILLVSVGALYGVLVKTGKYRALIEKIANNLRGAELVFLIGSAASIAIITSIFDYGFSLFIFIPFIIGIILTMGYDRITACLATFGAMLIGTIGSTFGSNTAGFLANSLGVDAGEGILFRLLLLVTSLIALIVFLALAKRTKNVTLEESKEETVFIGEKIANKYSVAPIIVILSLVFILLVLGCTKWADTFDLKVFNAINDKVTNFTVKLPQFHITTDGVETSMEKVAIFGKLLGKNVALGEWYYSDMSIICLVSAFILGLFYRMKLNNTFKNMANGAMKMLKPALLVLFIYCVVFFAASSMFFPTIMGHLLSIGKGFNLFFNALITIIGSALHIDAVYIASYMLPQMAATGANSTVLLILTQSLYGVTMFVAPTSVILALGLSYLGISYKDWMKKIWLLPVILFGVSIAVTVAAMIIL